MKMINILHIEDDEDDVMFVKTILNQAGIPFTQNVVSSKQNLLKALKCSLPDIVLSDHTLPTLNSLEALKIIKEKDAHLPFILITGNTSEEFALSVIKAGADDYILKDRMQRLPSALRKAVEKSELNTAQLKVQEDAARKMIKSEVKYQSFFESSFDGFLLTTPTGEILEANPAACAIFQMSEAEICAACSIFQMSEAKICGAGRFGIVDGSDLNLRRLIEEWQRCGKAYGELNLVRKDGSIFPSEISFAYFKDGNGQERISIIFRDITKRKQTEQKLIATSTALQQTLNIHEKIMKSSLDVICSIDHEGKFVTVSAASENIWGYTPEELFGKVYMDLVLPEDVKKTTKSAMTIMKGTVATNFENRYVHKNGNIVSMLWSARWDDNDKLMYCIAKNITYKKRLEKAFEIERQRFDDLYSQAPSCMGILKGPDYVFEMANPLYLQLIGKKDIIGKTVKEVLPEVESQGVFAFLDGVFKTGKTFSANEMLVKFDLNGTGKLVDKYLNFIYQAHRNENGDIDGILFFAIDVTEQVLSRQTIERSEKKFRQIVETAQEGIWMIDENNKTIFVNKKMCDILGYSEAEMLGKSNLFFKDEEAQKLSVIRLEEGKKGNGKTHESNFITKSGRKICTQISTNPVYDNSLYKGALAMVTDITDKKQLQQQLLNEQIKRQKQITRAALEAQEEERNYLGGELHDNINQILAAVKLQLGHCYGSPNAEKPLIKTAQKNVELAMSEIRHLSQKLVTHRFGEELFIPMVNNLVLQLFAPGVATVNVCCFDETIATEIKLTLYRIIQEHFSNVIKHAKAKQVILSIYSNQTTISVTIEDDGIGFDLSQHRKGVGITNIRNRAESYNGTIEIISAPGKGCKLKAILPIG